MGNLPGSADFGDEPGVELAGRLQPRVHCEREVVLASRRFAHATFNNTQKPKFARWQPLDPKWIGALILRASYTEAFHAPTLLDLTPAGSEGFLELTRDPKGLTPPVRLSTLSPAEIPTYSRRLHTMEHGVFC
jgi:hypothetical protein